MRMDGETGKNVHLAAFYIRHQGTAEGVGFHQLMHVKNNAFIDAVLRLAAMQASRRDVNRVPGGKQKGFLVNGHGKLTGYHMQQFRLRMPMVGHFVAGMIPVDEVIIQGVVRGAALHAFTVA